MKVGPALGEIPWLYSIAIGRVTERDEACGSETFVEGTVEPEPLPHAVRAAQHTERMPAIIRWRFVIAAPGYRYRFFLPAQGAFDGRDGM